MRAHETVAVEGTYYSKKLSFSFCFELTRLKRQVDQGVKNTATKLLQIKEVLSHWYKQLPPTNN